MRMDAQTTTELATIGGSVLMPPVAKLKLLSDIHLAELPLAERLVLALDAVTLVDERKARDAERMAARIRFALARVHDVRPTAGASPGASQSARLEVAESILAVHVARGLSFVDALVARAPKAPQSRRVAERSTDTPLATQERAA